MDLINIIANAHGGRGLDSIGQQFGLDRQQTQAALEQLAPVVAAGLRRNASSPRGMLELVNALETGGHDRYLDDPEMVQFGNVADDGNRILGHIFGNKDVSREVAMRASGETGIGGAILKQLLPVIASMVLGSVTRKMGGGQARQPRGGGGLGDILGDILGGGQARRPTPQPKSGGGLGDVLGDILGGGSRGASERSPGGGGLTDILGDILGGGRRQADRPSRYDDEEPDFSYDKDAFGRHREQFEDVLGRGTSSGSAADDLLSSVERHLRRM